MDLIFNELSLYHKQKTSFEAKKLLETFLLACKKVKFYDLRHIRVNREFRQSLLSENYTINDWLNDKSLKKIYKDLILGLIRFWAGC